ncbi:probable ubiquitin carboxyl-terminal hydrolase MINDY-4 isoform X2 [Pristis pectinata]|uniref:probable ubiquitin carboxyl-terminal hydrolase MINDY-4 isoform X2 n=1 Tax=Pristis pectinata TaxID=685728 RepID=UPI00223DBA4B|nr:probable ubiquitin carboxyl-terminal hydrolase MINDY-4 isoform X2 [Pristis pectinata]
MDNSSVEETAAALVREYLSRKGLKKTISAMDQELPRSEGSINTRNELKKVLHLEFLYKQNKAQVVPLKTMLEVVTKYFLDYSENTKNVARDSFRTPAIVSQRAPAVRFDNTLVNIYDISDEDKGGGVPFHDLNKMEACRFSNDSPSLACMSVPSCKTLQSSLKKKDRSPGGNGCPSGGEPGLLPVNVLSQDSSRVSMFPIEARGTNMDQQRPRSSRIVRGMMPGPVRTVQEDPSKKRLSKRGSGSNLTLHVIESDVDSGACLKGYARQSSNSCENAAGSDWLPAAGSLVDHMMDGTSSQDYPQMKPSGYYPGSRCSQKPQDFRWYHEPVDDLGIERLSERARCQTPSGLETKLPPNLNANMPERSRKVKFAPECMNIEHKARDSDAMDIEDLHARMSSMCSENQLEERLQLADIDDDDFDEVDEIPTISSLRKHHIDSKPIDQQLAVQLKNLLFGSSFCCFAEEWKIQSFTFNDLPELKYGIVQKKGGPCGVLAAVQACVLQKLIFEDVASSSSESILPLPHRELRPSNAQRSQSLALAIADILWRAGDRRRAVVALSTGRQQFIPAGKYKADGTVETIILNTLTNFKDLTTFLQQNVGQFEIGPFGCILLTLSAILSRSIELVKSDFDVPTSTLVGAHGYCTQELVNLLLTGKAVSNVFNDVVELDSGNGNITVLKGISGRSDIGLLSLFEHYSICKVGSFLKTPKFPIWVVCSESHFSVLFCLKKELLSDWKFERRFDLYYYDGLANQQDEIRLTITAALSSG